MPLRVGHRPRRHLCDIFPLKLHGQRFRAQPLSLAGGTRALVSLEPLVPPNLFAGVFFAEPVELQPRAVTLRTPTVLRIERKQARIKLLETAVALRARPARGEQHLRFCRASAPLAIPNGG